jgi:hypothetical protein
MQVVQYQQQGMVRGNYIQGINDLAQHALARGAKDLALQDFALFALNKSGKLHQPCWRSRCQDAHHGVPLGTAAQMAKRLEDGIIWLFAGISLDALPANRAYLTKIRGCASYELIHHGGLPDAWFAGHERHLALVPQTHLKTMA